MELLLPITTLKGFLPLLAILAAIFVISTKNAIISVFNLIILYILVAFYLIYLGITFLGISYIIIYIGAIAILFLFIIMMIDIEVVEKRSNNYLPLLFLLLGGFLLILKNIFSYIGLMKIKSVVNEEEKIFFNQAYENLFNIGNTDNIDNKNIINKEEKNLEVNDLIPSYISNKNDNFFLSLFKDKDTKNFFNIDSEWKIWNIEFTNDIVLTSKDIKINSIIEEKDIYINNILLVNNYIETYNNYLLVSADWSSALNRITQITAIGDVLYSVYHSYIYILSIILLLSMIGAIILTMDYSKEIRTLNLLKNKKNSILPFFFVYSVDNLHSEDILGNLIYYIIANFIIAVLLLGINSYFSLSIKYLEKGGGFECGFTSFVQTRERFNVLFYRVSLLFLIFDLEIILAFPYTAASLKNQNIIKNNVLIFLYILVIGFIYELKEGALNLVKKAHSFKNNFK